MLAVYSCVSESLTFACLLFKMKTSNSLVLILILILILIVKIDIDAKKTENREAIL